MTKGAETDDFDYTSHLIVQGSASSYEASGPLTEDEERGLRKARRRAEQRRKPLGFAPWPNQ